MAILNSNREWAESWAWDSSNDIIGIGEIWDVDVINQSITNILSTNYGERIFLPSFGSSLIRYIFSNITSETGEKLLDTVIGEILKWEDRITINDRECKLMVSPDSNSIVLIINYTILRTNVNSIYKKKIINS